MSARTRLTAAAAARWLMTGLGALLSACGDSDEPPIAVLNFQAAVAVIGQGDFTSKAPATSANGLTAPAGNPAVHNDVLYLPDTANNRVLGFNGIGSYTGAGADFVLGQPGFTTVTAGTGADNMNQPGTVQVYNNQLFVTDYGNHRVLIWNPPVPTATGVPANIVVGWPDFATPAVGCGASTLFHPESLHVVAGKLIVADSGNNRVLIWNTIPTVNGVPADIVLGQSGFTTCIANDDDQNGAPDSGPSARTLYNPNGVTWSTEDGLIISDTNNNRVLIWENFPTGNFAAADQVLGQLTMTTNTPGVSRQDLSSPKQLHSIDAQLFVADNGNNRVLIWNYVPNWNYPLANRVLGQSDYDNNAPNDDNQNGDADANPSARTLSGPSGAYGYADWLFVADTGNNRYLIYETK